jgi:hypothetical protein
MGRLVKPETVRVPISEGDFIELKKRLTHGEREDMSARLMPTLTPGERPQVLTKDVRTVQVLTYLVRWSLRDDDNVPLPMGPELPESDRYAMIRDLDPDTFDEIYDAIQAHERATAQEKKLTPGVRRFAAM